MGYGGWEPSLQELLHRVRRDGVAPTSGASGAKDLYQLARTEWTTAGPPTEEARKLPPEKVEWLLSRGEVLLGSSK